MKKEIWIIGFILAAVLVGGFYEHHKATAPTTSTSDVTFATTTTEDSLQTSTTSTQQEQKVPVSFAPNQTITITEADNGTNVTVTKGTRIAMALGGEVWTLSRPSEILTPLKNIGNIPGIQAIYTAHTLGQTTITAEGRPNCKEGDVCAQYIKNFTVTIKVVP